MSQVAEQNRRAMAALSEAWFSRRFGTMTVLACHLLHSHPFIQAALFNVLSWMTTRMCQGREGCCTLPSAGLRHRYATSHEQRVMLIPHHAQPVSRSAVSTSESQSCITASCRRGWRVPG